LWIRFFFHKMSSVYVNPQVDTQLLTDPVTGRSKAPRSKIAKNQGRTSVITPQSFVAFTVVPYSDKANRSKNVDHLCIAPYTEDDAAYMGFEGEIAWTRTNDFSARTGSDVPNGMPSVRVFTNLAGILKQDVDSLRPVGMMKNSGAGYGTDQSLDNEAGVVIGMGLCTITNTGCLPITAGHLVWVSPFPFSDIDAEGRKVQGIDTPFVSKGKWYGATYSLTDNNVRGMCKQLNELFDPLVKAGKALDPVKLSTQTAKNYIRTQVDRIMKQELQLTDEMPMYRYGMIKAALKLLDSYPEESTPLPPVVKVFAAEVLNFHIDSCRKTFTRYEKQLGYSSVTFQKTENTAQYESYSYQKFTCLFRGRLEEALSVEQNRSHEWLERLILGRAVTGARPGYCFDILIGYGR
jgi:hypothetical protein